MPANYLSRNVVEAIDMSNEDLVELQNQDKFCVSLKHLLKKMPLEKEYSKLVPQMTELSHSCFIEEGFLWKRITRHHGQHTVIVVPKTLSERILSEVHGNVLYGHEGQYKTKERIIQSYWWPGMEGQINKHLKECDKCQRTKKDKWPTTNFSSPLPQCAMPNQRVHMDLFAPLKTSGSGKKYIMCITDAFSKYVELVAIPDKSATTVASALFSRWLCRHGLPIEMVSDRGKEICNEVVNEMLKLMSIKKTTTSPYHPKIMPKLRSATNNSHLPQNPSGFQHIRLGTIHGSSGLCL
jgi:hypothetical protein